MNDDVNDLIRELAVEHGVALERGDPILVLQTATRRILEGVLRQAQQAQSEALRQHRSELEDAAAKWHEDSKRTASQFLQHVPTSIASGVSTELNRAASATVLRLEQALERHNKALARATLTCALSAAVAMLAAATFIWTSLGTWNRVDTQRGGRGVHRGNRRMQVALDSYDRATVYADLREEESLTDDLRARAIERARQLGAEQVEFWRPPYGCGGHRMAGFVALACVPPAPEPAREPGEID